MPVAASQLDRALISDPALRPDRRQGRRGRALSRRRTASRCSRAADLLGIGHMADAVNRAQARRPRHVRGEPAHQPDQHLHRCGRRASSARTRGCRRKKARTATRSSRCAPKPATREQHADARVPHRRRARHAGGARVLRRDVPRRSRRDIPHVHIKALTAVEIAHIARIEKMSWRDVLIALREAGLDTMPGGGAEVFSPARARHDRRQEARRRGVHRRAPRGARARHPLATARCCTATSRRSRTASQHLSMLRDLQDETGGFLAYIPLAYHPDNNELGETLGTHGHGDHRLRRPARTSPSGGSSSTTSTTSSRTGSW